ncbi:MAG: hypothetical protein OXG37_16640 [Actinomycetia bacterium]|nr:hypothetical protein [Actinomycetes bacterium]
MEVEPAGRTSAMRSSLSSGVGGWERQIPNELPRGWYQRQWSQVILAARSGIGFFFVSGDAQVGQTRVALRPFSSHSGY